LQIKAAHNKGFAPGGLKQNSTVIFQFNFSNNISFCTLISRPNAKPKTVARFLRKKTAKNINPKHNSSTQLKQIEKINKYKL
jgi:hypothetical protein